LLSGPEEYAMHFVQVGGVRRSIKCQGADCQYCSQKGLKSFNRYVCDVVDTDDGRVKRFSMSGQLFAGIKDCLYDLKRREQERGDVVVTGNERYIIRRLIKDPPFIKYDVIKYDVTLDTSSITYKETPKPKVMKKPAYLCENYEGEMSPYRIKNALRYLRREGSSEDLVNILYANIIQALNEGRCKNYTQTIKMANRIRLI
jgi:hypothetical protein